MSLYRKKPYFIPPLFDRMSHDLPELLTEEGVIDSLRNEISLMFNTRTTVSIMQPKYVERHVWREDDKNLFANPEIFGLIDFSDVDFSDPIQVGVLESLLEQTMCIFDRRLANIRVVIQKVEHLQNRFIFRIYGTANLQARAERITFPIDITLDAFIER